MSVRLRRLWIQLTSDRRRLGALGVCVVLGLLLWARIIIVSNLPRTAIAEGVASTSGSSAGSGKTKQSPPDPVAIRTPRAATAINLFSSPDRDPFVISPRYFPKPTPVAATIPEEDKSAQEPAEDAHQIENRRIAFLQTLVGKMRLEAAMGGAMAVISGKAYHRGEAVPCGEVEQVHFVLVEVMQRSVILEGEGHRFELKMASPGRE